MRRPLVLALLMLLPAILAGCVATPAGLVAPLAADAGRLVVTDPEGEAIPYVAWTLLAGERVLARGATGPDGTLALPTTVFDRALLHATGYTPRSLSRVELFASPVLVPDHPIVDYNDTTPLLRVLAPLDLGSAALGPPQACEHRNTCGLSEPVIEVAGDGTIYASSTCCIGKAPPVWVSRDNGTTFEPLKTPGVREAVGIEGDFAIDDAGNVYFTDILLGALWLTSWDKTGAWRHSVPVPLAPLVDRPWVRAGAEDVVYFLYNTGVSTNLHVSTDGGRTFLPAPTATFPEALGTLGQGPERDHLWVVTSMSSPKLYESADGGATWGEPEDIPTPPGENNESNWQFAVPVVDEAGRVLVAFDWGSEETGYGVWAALRETDGTWRLSQVSPSGGTHHMPWPAAGPDGGFVLAWYGTDDDAATPNTVADDAQWYVHLAATHDAGASWQVVRADPDPVATGPLNRRLLDFLQVDLGPAGSAHLVYAENRDGSRAERTQYVRTTLGLGLAPLAFPHGPKAEAADEGGAEGTLRLG